MPAKEIDPKIVRDLKTDAEGKLDRIYLNRHPDLPDDAPVFGAIRNYIAAVVDSAMEPNDRSGPQKIVTALDAVKVTGAEIPNFDASFADIKNFETKIRRDVASAIREWQGANQSGYLGNP